ncbi:MAG TPA: cupin domain-containing protein [Solirubrobacteraceae bacterium]|nr:cupin domain-containing protein [Solirubrobacteraceae bacterium]
MSDYTITKLEQCKDFAAANGVGEAGEIRFPREDVEAKATGFAHLSLHPNKRHPFPHRHQQAEEIYLVLSGSGRVKLEDEMRDLSTHDIVRVAPQVTRGFEAGPDGMELLAFGARHEGDGEIVADFWEA